MEGYSHRTSAAALRSRGLLRIAGRGPTWRAELTDSGRALAMELEQRADLTDAPIVRDGPSSASRTLGAPSRNLQRAKTEQLVADVIAAGGRLLLPDETANGGINWRQRAYAAQRHGKVPDGKHLTVSWTSAGFEIDLIDGQTGNEVGAEQVPVPTRVRNYHPAVREFREHPATHEISRKALPRALRIMHGLATALDKRGHKTACVRARQDGYGRSEWKASDAGQFAVTLNSHDFKLRLNEKGVGLRGPWEAHRKRREDDRAGMRFDRWDVERIEPYDKGATGQIDISILAYGPRQTTWGDRKRWSLEDRLPQYSASLKYSRAKPRHAGSAASASKKNARVRGKPPWRSLASEQSSTIASRCLNAASRRGKTPTGSAPIAPPSRHVTARRSRQTLARPSGSRFLSPTPMRHRRCPAFHPSPT